MNRFFCILPGLQRGGSVIVASRVPSQVRREPSQPVVGNAHILSVEGRESRITYEPAAAAWMSRKGSPMSAIAIQIKRLRVFLRGFGRTDPEELRHAAQVSLWVRWFVMAFCLLEVNYRVEYGALSHILNNCYVIGFMAVNGYVQYLVRRHGEAKPAWLLGLSAMDLAGISFSVSLSGGFDSPYFPCTTSRWPCSPGCSPPRAWPCLGPRWWSSFTRR